MSVLIVLDNPSDWPLRLAEPEGSVKIVAAKRYLSDPAYGAQSRLKVFNLCRSYRYQTVGYYVSLLAEARGHRPLPSIPTIQDLKLTPVIRLVSQELNELIERTLRPLRSERFELSIYFGHNMVEKYDRLSLALFGQFPAPLLRASFRHNGAWSLEGVRVIGTGDIPDDHRDFVLEQARRFFRKPHPKRKPKAPARFDLALLHDEADPLPPSNKKAIRKFVDAAEAIGIRAEIIGANAYGRIAEFDALFIRDTTKVNHYTYRFARRATAEGMVVVDDPVSILRCTNKVYLAELLERHKLPTPRTLIVSRENVGMVKEKIGFPCVIKQPDSAFSAGVVKADTEADFDRIVEELFEQSELLLAQEFVPTEFDWRIGVLGGEPLYACRYFMARRHWQILKREGERVHEGNAETLPVDKAPRAVVSLAVKVARLIGDGLYGVDIKVVEGQPRVIEINDNPSIDAGVEDSILGDALYEKIMRFFLDRLEAKRREPVQA